MEKAVKLIETDKILRITSIKCTFKMYNVKMSDKPNYPVFYVDFDLLEKKITITHPKKGEAEKIRFHRWLLKELFSDILKKEPEPKELSNGGFEITIKLDVQNTNNEEVRLLFNKISSRLFAKRKNYIYEVESICFVNKNC